jgi:hypothetical protein
VPATENKWNREPLDSPIFLSSTRAFVRFAPRLNCVRVIQIFVSGRRVAAMQDVMTFTVAARYHGLLRELKAVTDEAEQYRRDIVSNRSLRESPPPRAESARSSRPASLREVLARVAPHVGLPESPVREVIKPQHGGPATSRGLEDALEAEVRDLRERIAAVDSRYEALLAMEEVEDMQFDEEIMDLESQLQARLNTGVSSNANADDSHTRVTVSKWASSLPEYSAGSPQRRRLEKLMQQFSKDNGNVPLTSTSPATAPLINALNEHKQQQDQLKMLIAQRRQLLELDETCVVQL